MIPRRKFIWQFGTATVAAICLSSVSGIAGQSAKTSGFLPPEKSSNPLSYLTREHFESLVGTFWQINVDDNYAVQLRLIEVKDLTKKINVERGYTGESFSLLFQVSAQQPFPQETYLMKHADLEEFPLLLVPVGQRTDRYESIINRISSGNPPDYR